MIDHWLSSDWIVSNRQLAIAWSMIIQLSIRFNFYLAKFIVKYLMVYENINVSRTIEKKKKKEKFIKYDIRGCKE